MDLQLLTMCRICLKDEQAMVSIFNPETNDFCEVSLLTRLLECCEIQVLPKDGLPQQICFQCVNHINIAYELRTLSACSDSKLRKYLSYDTGPSNDSHNVTPQLTPLEKAIPVDENQSEPDKKLEKKSASNKKKKKKSDEEVGTKTFPCLDCGREFTYQSMLREHQVSHTGARPYLCSVCGKSFAHHASLSNHIKIHSSEKPHQCDMCSQSFNRRAHLVFHRRTHTGEKPFSCTDCGRDFAQASYLKEHKRLHSGEKPFVCEDCGHGFARRSCLVMHRRVHTGELPYACPDCDRSFSQRSQRKRHVKRNHKGSAALGTNGELFLRDHDKLRDMLTKIKTDEKVTAPSASANTSSSPSQPYQHFMLEMPLASTCVINICTGLNE